MNSCLYEAWLSCSGNWKSSKLYISLVNKKKNKSCGVRRWFLRSELIAKFGSDIAEDIINRKMTDDKLREEETRVHPDLPDREDCAVSALYIDASCLWLICV